MNIHDIQLAEGLPTESYLNWGDRPFPMKGACHVLASPNLAVSDLDLRRRSVAVDGVMVENERRRLDAVFATALATHCVSGGASDLTSL